MRFRDGGSAEAAGRNGQRCISGICKNSRRRQKRRYRQAYVNKWENLNAQLAGIQAQKTQLETAKSGLLAQAGFATEADLDAQITSLTAQRDELDKERVLLLGQETDDLPHRKKSC